jgi:hypothetical protein
MKIRVTNAILYSLLLVLSFIRYVHADEGQVMVCHYEWHEQDYQFTVKLEKKKLVEDPFGGNVSKMYTHYELYKDDEDFLKPTREEEQQIAQIDGSNYKWRVFGEPEMWQMYLDHKLDKPVGTYSTELKKWVTYDRAWVFTGVFSPTKEKGFLVKGHEMECTDWMPYNTKKCPCNSGTCVVC